MQETIAGRPATDARRLWLAAKAVAANAYAPYSGLRVGAALETVAGRTFTGVNVENASYPAGLCAERAALAAAVAAGERRFAALAVATDSGAPLLPCGVCLQALSEFGELSVITGSPAQTSDSSHSGAQGGAQDGSQRGEQDGLQGGAQAVAPTAELRVVALRDLLPTPFRLPGDDPGER